MNILSIVSGRGRRLELERRGEVSSTPPPLSAIFASVQVRVTRLRTFGRVWTVGIERVSKLSSPIDPVLNMPVRV